MPILNSKYFINQKLGFHMKTKVVGKATKLLFSVPEW